MRPALRIPFFCCSVVGSALNWRGMGGADDAFIGSFHVLLYVFNHVQTCSIPHRGLYPQSK